MACERPIHAWISINTLLCGTKKNFKPSPYPPPSSFFLFFFLFLLVLHNIGIVRLEGSPCACPGFTGLGVTSRCTGWVQEPCPGTAALWPPWPPTSPGGHKWPGAPPARSWGLGAQRRQAGGIRVLITLLGSECLGASELRGGG